MSDFSPLTLVGRDKVKITKASLNDAINFKRDFDVSTVSVASLRLDAVVAAITPLSREKGIKAIELGLVTHNYELATKGSSQVNDGDIISVKGYGKFVINLTDQVSKKGKIKIKAMKYT